MMNRRQAIASGVAATAVAVGGCAHGSAKSDVPVFAITIDDFQIEDDVLLSGEAKHRAILDALDEAGVQAAGFVAGRHLDSRAGHRHLSAWSEAGHAIGNHTYAHAYYGGADPGDLGADIDRLSRLLAAYPNVRPWFRFPYLAEGRTIETRERMRAALRERGLMNGHVTIDASDWYVSRRLVDKLRREPGADVAPYGDYLVAHLLDRARFYDGLAREVLRYSPPHTLLIHHNLATALFLPQILSAFRHAGWRAIDADQVFAHAIYRSQPDIAPAAHSLIWQLAKADGRFDDRLRSPGEDGRYEQPAMDALGL